MAKRPPPAKPRRVRVAAHPGLGQFFQRLHGKKLTQSAIPARVFDKLGERVSYQAIRGLERGETKRIDPDLLRTLARFYDRSYTSFVVEVVRHLYGVELAEQGLAARAEIENLSAQLERERAHREAAEDQLARLRAQAQRFADHALEDRAPPREERPRKGSKLG